MAKLEIPESNEGRNDIIAGLARLAKEVVSGARKGADEKMDGHEKHTTKIVDGLDEIAEAFDTDPEASLTPYQMEAQQATAVVNFIRSLFSMDPLEEGEEVDLERDLVVEKGKPPVLTVGAKQVRFRDLDFSKVEDEGERVVKAALSSVAMKDGLKGKHCWDWVNKIYKAAGSKPGEVLFAVDHYGNVGTFNEDMLVPGAWVYYHNRNKSDKYGDHSAILESYDKNSGMAWMLSFPGPGKTPRRHQVDLHDMPVQRVQVPKNESLQA